ncbi:hypothetical protein Sdiek1_0286 [Sulfurospirillum diekertiae]|uniref:Translation initiation factor IF-2 N-terminal domain-containing protein n=1 Tax=Sulfurospirillum diekertiae TaxID=1854492 RepID=A0A1Y0HH88_9BACT|nr:hypothetical protein Sdiek1_0286 [Sulfurospirillum diekertiae]ASC92318.1 hypothetical protein Sdiek2_0280 [Sulfurospirillum diekertiae]
MDKVRIAEIAKELGMKNKDIIEKAMGIGLDVKGHASAITTEDAEKLINYILSGENAQASKPSAQPKTPEIKKVEVVETPPLPVVEKPIVHEVITPKTKTLKEKELETGIVAKAVLHDDQIAKVATEASSDTEEDMEEKLDPTNVRKRRGLVIVKKKRPDVKEVEVEEKESPSSFYGARENTPSRSIESMFSSSNAASELQKKKKKVKKSTCGEKSKCREIRSYIEY